MVLLSVAVSLRAVEVPVNPGTLSAAGFVYPRVMAWPIAFFVF